MAITLIIGNKNYSSWSLRPWLFLKHHGIAFNEVRIPLYRDDTSARIAEFSPAGKVPVLLDNDLTVWDSLAILEYLSERFPRTQGWPVSPAERAKARSLAAEMHAGFANLRNHCGMNCRRQPDAKALPDVVHKEVERIGQIWRECRETHAVDGPWLSGSFGILDAMYAPVALRFHSYRLEAGQEAQAYVATVLGHQAVKEWMAAGQAETEIIPVFEA
ncbi:MAG: glutathione S-transferase family protein [Methylomonas sp.]|nr:glutathione S-transferase family protein [Methylomonas sp.]